MEHNNIFLYPTLVSQLDNHDRYNLKVSNAVLFLPPNIKSVFYSAMNENRLNEHLMLNCLMNYVLLEEESSILERLDKDAKSIVCAYLNEKILLYLREKNPKTLFELI